MGWTIILYVGIVAIGALIGSKMFKQDREYNWVRYIQLIALIILIFTMGARIGADERVFQSMDIIGTSALVISLFAIIGSVFFVYIGRKLMGINREGVKKHD